MEISLKSNLDGIADHLRYNSKRSIERAERGSLNYTVAKLRTAANRQVQEEIQPRRGAKGKISKKIRAIKARRGHSVARIVFDEQGVGVEHTAKATVRKVRGKAGRYHVSFRGRSLRGAFGFPGAGKAAFIRRGGKKKRLFSFTVLQEAEKLDIFDRSKRKAPALFVPEFVRLVDIFDGYKPRRIK